MEATKPAATPPTETIAPVRNPAATTTGIGASVVLAWLYNGVLAPRYGLPEMPEMVVIPLSIFLTDVVRLILTRTRVVGPEVEAVPVPVVRVVKRKRRQPKDPRTETLDAAIEGRQ